MRTHFISLAVFVKFHFGRTLPIALTAVLLCGGFASRASADFTYTPLNVPAAVDTLAHGVSGSTIVGHYTAGGTQHGFSYDGATYTTFDVPASAQTFAQGVSGSTIVGFYTDTGDAAGHLHGFVYDGATYTTLDHPLAPAANSNADTAAYGIFGSTVVGTYNPGPGIAHGFTYDGSTYTNLSDHPLGTNRTTFEGIFGSTMVGSFTDGGGQTHGFSYDGASFTTLDHPLATPGPGGTRAHGVYGSNIVGSYENGSGTHGFLYDGSTYTTLDVLLSPNTNAQGIYGNTVVGSYYDTISGPVHGFVTTVPEPGCLALACVGGLCLLRRRCRAQLHD